MNYQHPKLAVYHLTRGSTDQSAQSPVQKKNIVAVINLDKDISRHPTSRKEISLIITHDFILKFAVQQ